MARWNRYHYNAIAKDLRGLWQDERGNSDFVRGYVTGHNAALGKVIISLSERFKKDNPEFDSGLFVHAAIPEDHRKKIIEELLNATKG